MKRFDASLEPSFQLTDDEIAFSKRVDGIARLERLEDLSKRRDTLRRTRQSFRY
jgi:hypothetical protein